MFIYFLNIHKAFTICHSLCQGAGHAAHCGSMKWEVSLSVLVLQKILLTKFAFSQNLSFSVFDMSFFPFHFSISGKESIIAGPFSCPVVYIWMTLQSSWMRERYVHPVCVARKFLIIWATCPPSPGLGNSAEMGSTSMCAASRGQI